MSEPGEFGYLVGPARVVRRAAGKATEQGKSKPQAPRGSTVGEILDNAEERRRVLSETLPPPSRIMDAADTYSTAAAKIFLEAAMRTALNIERMLPLGAVVHEIPPRALAMISSQADAHRRTMRDAYLTAALEMLKMIGGDFDPEPWDYGEELPGAESSTVNQDEKRICELYHELTEQPERTDNAT